MYVIVWPISALCLICSCFHFQWNNNTLKCTCLRWPERYLTTQLQICREGYSLWQVRAFLIRKSNVKGPCLDNDQIALSKNRSISKRQAAKILKILISASSDRRDAATGRPFSMKSVIRQHNGVLNRSSPTPKQTNKRDETEMFQFCRNTEGLDADS